MSQYRTLANKLLTLASDSEDAVLYDLVKKLSERMIVVYTKFKNKQYISAKDCLQSPSYIFTKEEIIKYCRERVPEDDISQEEENLWYKSLTDKYPDLFGYFNMDTKEIVILKDELLFNEILKSSAYALLKERASIRGKVLVWVLRVKYYGIKDFIVLQTAYP